MAVYTKYTRANIVSILSNYSIGDLENFEGIQQGIENTNYFLLVDKKKYILTIYEKRVKEEDLPFFSELMGSLNKSGFRCPVPILNKKNEAISKFENKKLVCGNIKLPGFKKLPEDTELVLGIRPDFIKPDIVL